MVSKTMSGTVRVDLSLTRIVIDLDRFGKPPVVRLEGELHTRQPRVGLSTQAVITTRHLGRTGEAWVNEMRDAIAAAHPVKEGLKVE